MTEEEWKLFSLDPGLTGFREITARYSVVPDWFCKRTKVMAALALRHVLEAEDGEKMITRMQAVLSATLVTGYDIANAEEGGAS